MKPLNEKERTSAFLQFLLLYIFTVTITLVFVFADYKVQNADYKVLKRRAKDIADKEKYFSNLTLLVDTINHEINNLSKLDNASFEVRKSGIGYLISKLETDNAETNYTNPLKKSIKKTTLDWYADQIRLREIEVLRKKIEIKEENNNRLMDILKDQGLKRSDVEMLLKPEEDGYKR